MGLVIVAGLSFGTLVSLFVIPAFYRWMGATLKQPEAKRDHEAPHALAPIA
jgi:multidrug efflux pump